MNLHLFIVALLAALSLFAEAVTIQRESPFKITARTSNYELRVENSTVSMHTIQRSTGMVRENDYIKYQFESWADQILWGYTPDNGTEQCNITTTPSLNFTGPYVADAVDGPNGTVLVSTSTPFADTCNISFIFYTTDNDTAISIDGFLRPISAREVKFSIRIYCPWREQLQRFAGVNLSTPIWARGRGLYIQSYFDFNSSSTFQGYPDVNFPYFPPGWLLFPWSAYRACLLSPMQPDVPEYPTPSIYPNFNFTYQSDLTIKTERAVFSASYQTWSIADATRRALILAVLGNRTLEISNGRYIHWPVDILMEFYNTSLYDPSMVNLFLEDDEFEAGNRGQQPQACSPGQACSPSTTTTISNAVVTSAVVGVVVGVVVIAIISIAVIALVPSLRSKVQPFFQRSQTPKVAPNEIDEAEAPQSQDPKANQKWVRTHARTQH